MLGFFYANLSRDLRSMKFFVRVYIHKELEIPEGPVQELFVRNKVVDLNPDKLRVIDLHHSPVLFLI